MKILSLFDGMSCGRLALLDAGVPVDRYVAFEIDKFAVQTSLHNFPEIEHRGDVFSADFTEFAGFDFLLGGSPCTYWSIAQKNNRETEPSGMGWELFQQYVRALNEAKPLYFIYENNKSMSNAIRESISTAFGFEPIWINSALVSAQTRQRLYWVGKRNPAGGYCRVNVEQPADRGILLRHILETSVDHRSMSSPAFGVGYRNRREKDGCLYRRFETGGKEKANALTTVQTDSMVAEFICSEFESLSDEYYHGDDNTAVFGKIECKNSSNNKGQPAQGTRIYKTDNKAVCLNADSRNYIIDHFSPRFIDRRGKDIPVYEVKNGKIVIKGREYPIRLPDGVYVIRKLTVVEGKRLQTVPDWFKFPVSNAQAYKMLGNGWTVAVIVHLILSALWEDDAWMQ